MGITQMGNDILPQSIDDKTFWTNGWPKIWLLFNMLSATQFSVYMLKNTDDRDMPFDQHRRTIANA